MKLVTPYEDLIIDGAPAHREFESQSGCIVSSMGLGDEYLIGATPLDVTKPISFVFKTNMTGPHVLTNVATGAQLQTTASGAVTVNAALARTTVYHFAAVTI